MATVPFSAKLCDKIKEEATAPFRTQIAEATKILADDHELYYRWCVAETSKEQVDLALQLDAMNKVWCKKWNPTLQIQYRGATYSLNTNRPVPVPGHHTMPLKEEALLEPKYAAVKKRFLELHAPIALALADKHEIEQTLDKIFNEVPNLNRALEIMPSMINWVPSEYKDKLNAKVARAPKRRSAEEIKQDALTPEALAALARARMST